MQGDTYTLSNAKVRDVADFYKKFVMVCLGVAPWILVMILNSWIVDSHPCPTSWVNHGEGFFLNLSHREAVPGSLSLSLSTPFFHLAMCGLRQCNHKACLMAFLAFFYACYLELLGLQIVMCKCCRRPAYWKSMTK